MMFWRTGDCIGDSGRAIGTLMSIYVFGCIEITSIWSYSILSLNCLIHTEILSYFDSKLVFFCRQYLNSCANSVLNSSTCSSKVRMMSRVLCIVSQSVSERRSNRFWHLTMNSFYVWVSASYFLSNLSISACNIYSVAKPYYLTTSITIDLTFSKSIYSLSEPKYIV